MTSAAKQMHEAVQEEKKIALSEALRSKSVNKVHDIFQKAHEASNFCDMVIRLEADIVRIEEALEEGMSKKDDQEFAEFFVKAYSMLYDDEMKLLKTYDMALENIKEIMNNAGELKDLVKGLKKKHEQNSKQIPELYERYMIARQKVSKSNFQGLGTNMDKKQVALERARAALRHKWI